MVNKHFFKILILFVGMIALGLAGVFFASYLDSAQQEEPKQADTTDVASKEKIPETKANSSTTPTNKIKKPIAK